MYYSHFWCNATRYERAGLVSLFSTKLNYLQKKVPPKITVTPRSDTRACISSKRLKIVYGIYRARYLIKKSLQSSSQLWIYSLQISIHRHVGRRTACREDGSDNATTAATRQCNVAASVFLTIHSQNVLT